MTPTRPPLDLHLCLAVYRASHAFTAAYRPMLEPFGLTYPQYVVLLALWERGALSVKDLGAALDLDSGTLSPLLRRLDVAGLVTRTRSSDDGRLVVIAVTERGAALEGTLAHAATRLTGCSGLDVEQASALVHQLHAITAALRTSLTTTPREDHS